MKMKSERILSFLLCGAMLLGLLSGCGGEAAGGGTNTDTPDVPENTETHTADPLGQGIPASEYERGLWYGFLPD